MTHPLCLIDQARPSRRHDAGGPGNGTFLRPTLSGKFLQLATERFWVKGVSYGTFAPDSDGHHFPAPARIAEDFTLMRRAGVNTVRTYTVPDQRVLDLAEQHGLRLMVGVPWADHVAFLDDRRLSRVIRGDVVAHVRALASHPAVMMMALGNEIPAAVVRWLGPARVERFLAELYADAKAVAPTALFTYVNYPPTEYLNLPFVDVCAFNVYLHREHDLRAYLARLQNIAGHKPLLIAEAGADSSREGATGQATLTAMQLRTSFAEGACGAVAFAWTDEWWRGGHAISDWTFGLVDAERKPKPALQSVAQVFSSVPFSPAEQRSCPKVSVLVCAYNAADTLDECLTSLERLTYPDYEVIVVDDGSRDATGAIARRHSSCRVIEVDHAGLSAARNAALAAASGDIVAYTDADVRVDPEWLTYLVQPFATAGVVAAGGLSLPPLDSPWMAHCVARAPGGPTHVLLDDRTAEHVPGCNLAVRRDALRAIGGFNPIYLRAGDDVDVCWRLQNAGGRIEFVSAALVWHHHRASVRAYWRQQVGYGEGQSWLVPHHRERFTGAKIAWRGHVYSPLPFVRSLSRPRVNVGIWGSAAFPSVYHMQSFSLMFLPHSVRWQILSAALVAAALPVGFVAGSAAAAAVAAIGLAGLAITIGRCVRYALASDIETLPPIDGRSPHASRLIYRLVIAWLHVVQPFARATGYVRGMVHPPRVPPSAPVRPLRPSPIELASTFYLLGGGAIAPQFWAERGISADSLLTRMTEHLHATPLTRGLEVEDRWPPSRDIRVPVWPFAWLDLLVLVEFHDAGRSLVRIRLRLRPAAFTSVVVLASLGLPLALARGFAPAASAIAGVISVAGLTVAGTAVWRSARTLAVVRQIVSEVAQEMDMQPLGRPAEKRRAHPLSTDALVAPAQPCRDAE